MPDFPRSAMSRWKVITKLKDSGQSSVFKVERLTDGVQGVLKVPSAMVGQRERLGRETELLQTLSHPAIVRLLDFELAVDDMWLVTPLGVPLPEWWKRKNKGVGAAEQAALARSVAMSLLPGLAVVHQQGVVHRDIKPGNIIIVGDQPLFIDFGVAFAPDGERLTELDGRPVANTFAAPAAAYYGQIDRPMPWWDCLGIAWLWGWMLTSGRSPKDFRFHWKYHRMIESHDSERVRALMAVCSDENTAPLDAAAMGRLCTSLGLVNEVAPSSSSEPDFGRALELQTRQLQAELIEQQVRRERTEAAALVLAPMYETIRLQLIDIAERARERGLPVSTAPLINRHPIAICLSSLKEQQMSVELFDCRATPAKGIPFRIVLACEYRQLVAGAWPFRFTLTMNPGPGYADNDVVHMTDGSPRVNWACEPSTNDHFPRLFTRWLSEEAHWAEFRV